MKLLISLLISISAYSAIINIYSHDLFGRVTIERGDTIIISKHHPLIHSLWSVNTIICETEKCRQKAIKRFQYTFRTNGISIITVK